MVVGSCSHDGGHDVARGGTRSAPLHSLVVIEEELFVFIRILFIFQITACQAFPPLPGKDLSAFHIACQLRATACQTAYCKRMPS